MKGALQRARRKAAAIRLAMGDTEKIGLKGRGS